MKPTEQHVPSGQQVGFKIPHVVQSHARFLLWFTWDDPVNEEIPNSTWANFKAERNKSLLLVGLEPCP